MRTDRSFSSILDCLTQMEACDDFESMKKLVRSFARPYGYDRVLLFSTAAVRDAILDGIHWLEGTWFENGEAIDAETYINHCPVTRHLLDTDRPFFWTKTSENGTRYQFVDTPRGQGLHGLQIPVFGRAGLVGAMTFAGEHVESTAIVRLALEQIGVTAFRIARDLLEPPPASSKMVLSVREAEVLRRIAIGQRVTDVAVSLGLSERTVENHLRSVRDKLQTKTTTSAVAAAARLRILDP